jgi:hypothetical protein
MVLKCPNCSAALPLFIFTPKTFPCSSCGRKIRVTLPNGPYIVGATLWSLATLAWPFSIINLGIQLSVGILMWAVLSGMYGSVSLAPDNKQPLSPEQRLDNADAIQLKSDSKD